MLIWTKYSTSFIKRTIKKKFNINLKKKKILLLSWIYKEFEPPWKANFTAFNKITKY